MVQETDAKKAQLKELTEEIKTTGDSIRQLKNGMCINQLGLKQSPASHHVVMLNILTSMTTHNTVADIC